jgi:hypothetical protein
MPKPKKNPPSPKNTPEPAAALDLDALAKKLGPPPADFAARTFRNALEADLVKGGTAVDSINVLEDVPRFVASALAIQEALSEPQRALVRFPPALLPLLVAEALQLRDLKTKHDTQKSGDMAGKAQRNAEARRAMRDGIAERDLVYGSLRNALGDARLAEIDIVTGTADTADKLAAGLEGLADFIDRVTKAHKDDAVSLKEYGAGPERADALRAQAKTIRKLGKATAASGRRVTQRALDLQDGRVLLLIGIVLRAFRAGRRADATLLVPELNRLTRLFETRPRGRKGSSPPELPADDNTPASPG